MSRCKRYTRCRSQHLNLSTATFAILLYTLAILGFASFYSNPAPDGSYENLQRTKKSETVEALSAYEAKTASGILARFLENKPKCKNGLPDLLDRPTITNEKLEVVLANKVETVSGTTAISIKKTKRKQQKHPDYLDKVPISTPSLKNGNLTLNKLTTLSKISQTINDALQYNTIGIDNSRWKGSVTGLDDLLQLPRHDPSSSDLPINPHNFRYILNPVDLCTRGREPFLLAYVHTAPSNFRQRMAVRRTWGNGRYYDESFRLVFFLGKPLKEGEQERVSAEAYRYGDIVQEDFVDSYVNLTYKAVAALKWISEHCSHATYVLKADDDIFVNMFALLAIVKRRSDIFGNPIRLPSQPQHLRPRHSPNNFKKSSIRPENSLSPPKKSPNRMQNLSDSLENLTDRPKLAFNRPKGTILCAIQERLPVMRWGKWRIDRDYWKDDIYPPFCAGAAYVMTSDVIAALYRESLSVPNYVIDDVYVTGFLVMRLRHVTRVQLSQFYALFRVKPLDDVTESEWREKFIFYHSKSHDEYSTTWRRLVAIYYQELNEAISM